MSTISSVYTTEALIGFRRAIRDRRRVYALCLARIYHLQLVVVIFWIEVLDQ